MKKPNVFLYLFLFFFSGCAETHFFISPIATGIITWTNGESHKYYNEEAYSLYRSVKNSLYEMNFPIKKDDLYKKDGYYLIAGDKDKFKITIRKVRFNITEVKIRINFLGDKPYADLIYKKIDSNLNVIDFDEKGLPTKTKF